MTNFGTFCAIQLYSLQLGLGSLEMNQDIVELYVEGLNIDELTLISKESYPALS